MMLFQKVRQEINSILNALNILLGNANEKSRTDRGDEEVCVYLDQTIKTACYKACSHGM